MGKKFANLTEISFEQRDIDIFKIPEIKTRISTTQNYFFPRLEFLIRESLALISEIYDENPYDSMTIVTRPGNRLDAIKNTHFEEVYVGISGKKPKGKTIVLRNHEGKLKAFPVTGFLVYRIGLSGSIQVVLKNYGSGPMNDYNASYWSQVEKVMKNHLPELSKILALGQIGHWGASAFLNFAESFNYAAMMRYLETDNLVYSPICNFPTNYDRGLKNLILCFLALYPIASTLTRLAEGEKPNLPPMLERFTNWWASANLMLDSVDLFSARTEEILSKSSAQKIELPPMDSYSYIRAGVWWQVLARDKWTCLACGRTAKDGISLEVDHILPRSKGGQDKIENLQTLCKKCNIGKSNKDSTNLRFRK